MTKLTCAQDDQVDLLDLIDESYGLDTTPGWWCPHCGSRFERSEAETLPAHREPYPPSPIPGACASQKISLELLLIRLSPAHKTVAWTKYQDVLAVILAAKQDGVSDALLGRVLADEQLQDWVLLRQLLMGAPGAGDLRDPATQRQHAERRLGGIRDGVSYQCTKTGVEIRTGESMRLIRWRDLPAPGGTT
ncbi:hypothetical protein [Brevibacterium gallinarum]|uniref:C2H2-type domain-containing protein n=1 Tax=Brevibacterium gallinarum TaxID=2762220 RepID=A0ABR8WQS4_9MICO|nr:hypothetical protein [Brevibacterium gallinarum]MBD8019359.1 hypothetical protein [Brevibacterium gallinarum]